MLTNQESVIETTAQANKAPRSPPKELAGFTGDVLDHLGSSEDRFSFKDTRSHDFASDPEAIAASAMATGVWTDEYDGLTGAPTTPSKDAKESLFDYLRGLNWIFTKTPQEDAYPAAADSPESTGTASTNGNEDDHTARTTDDLKRESCTILTVFSCLLHGLPKVETA